jgi:hypothetical protein
MFSSEGVQRNMLVTESFEQQANAVKWLSCLLGLALALVVVMQTMGYLHAAPAIVEAQSAINPVQHSHRSNGNDTSANWAGYTLQDNPGTFQRAKVTFTIPKLTGSPNVNKQVSLWAGVGGDTTASNLVLVQAGVTSYIDPATGSYPAGQLNYAWWETVPDDGEATLLNFTQGLNAGDSVTVNVKSSPDPTITDPHKIADYFSITDHATGEAHSLTITTNDDSYQTDGAIAECILERPGFQQSDGNYKLYPLPKFTSSVSFTNCQVSKDANVADLAPIGSFQSSQLVAIDIASAQNKILAHTSSLTNKENFTVTWKAAGSSVTVS